MSLHCGLLARHIYPNLVLVQSRKTSPCLTEKFMMGRKESNQTNILQQTTFFGCLHVSLLITVMSYDMIAETK